MSRIIQDGTWAKFLHGLLKGWTGSGRETIYHVLATIDHRCWRDNCFVKHTWHGDFLRLEVDHVDGNPYNNDPQNLRLLCNHCHSQTPTYKVRRAYRQ
jgi:hypothetical protein